MNTTNRLRRDKLFTGVLAGSLLLISGCQPDSAGQHPIPVPGATPSSSTTPTTSSAVAAAPLKYSLAVKSCQEIQAEVPVQLTARNSDQFNQPTDSWRHCPFTESRDNDPLVVFQIRVWADFEDSIRVHSGAQRARENFDQDPRPSDGEDSAVDIGEVARWKKSSVAGCELEVLDENAILVTYYNPHTDGDPRDEKCRDRARDLARKFYSAVQPQ